MTKKALSIFNTESVSNYEGTRLFRIDDPDLAEHLGAEEMELSFTQLTNIVTRLRFSERELWGAAILRRRAATENAVKEYKASCRNYKTLSSGLYHHGSYPRVKLFVISNQDRFLNRSEAEEELGRWEEKRDYFLRTNIKELNERYPDENSYPRPNIDQESSIERFKNECQRLVLKKGSTIPMETLFEIMSSINEFSGTIDNFTTSCTAYKKGREYASRLQYSHKGSTLYDEHK